MAGFSVGNAMQRNKLIYALADCALVVNSDHQKGGTWAGAVEQLEKYRFVPVYVRRTSETNAGLDGLRRKGALIWPEPTQADTLAELLTSKVPQAPGYEALTLPLQDGSSSSDTPDQVSRPDPTLPSPESAEPNLNPAEALFAKVKELLEDMDAPKTNAEVADELQVSTGQAKVWLQRLVEEGVLEQLSKPTRFRSKTALGPLFDRNAGTPSNSSYDRAAN
jgi:predicted Rossmann fold nucleotide-binding protein DprA/Smf involved in DNA uptake